MKKGLLPRILITLLGFGLIFMGMSQAILGFAGKSALAVITDIRREGGERAEAVSNRYTYNISYPFTLPGGKEVKKTSYWSIRPVSERGGSRRLRGLVRKERGNCLSGSAAFRATPAFVF